MDKMKLHDFNEHYFYRIIEQEQNANKQGEENKVSDLEEDMLEITQINLDKSMQYRPETSDHRLGQDN